MHFKLVRLTPIRNESKRTISASGELRLLQLKFEFMRIISNRKGI